MVTRVVAVVFGLALLTLPAGARADSPPTLAVAPVPPGGSAAVTGSGWDPDPELAVCTLTTDVPGAVIGDGGCTVSTKGEISETVLIPTETLPGDDYVLTVCQPACNQVNGIGAEISIPLVVLEPTTITDDPVPPPPIDNGSSTGGGEAEDLTPVSGDWTAPVWWAVLAVLLLVGLVAAVRLRGLRAAPPATAQAVLRPMEPPVVWVEGADRPPRWTIGLAPRSDPGTITVEEGNR